MTPNTNTDSESANATSSDRDPNSKGKDVKKPMTDPRLKSILPLIATQLVPIQEVITTFAKEMLENTRALKNRKSTLAKFYKTTPENPSMYIPRSARLKTSLTFSKTLAKEAEIQDLQEELLRCNKEYGEKVSYIFERCAKLEEKHERISRIKTFLLQCHKLAQGLVIIEKRCFVLETNLSTERFTLWILIVFLRTIKIVRLSEPNIYDTYLHMEYRDVKTEFIQLFLPNDPTLENDDENNIIKRLGTEEEKHFRDKVVRKLLDLVIPTTFHLQLKLDQEEEKQITTSLITALYKRTETMKATEATALAVGDISPHGQSNMEQHIQTLVNKAVQQQLTKTTKTKPPPTTKKPSTSSKKQKNSPGGKKPQSSPPAKNAKGDKTKQQKKRKVSFRYPVSDTGKINNDDEVEHQPKKKQKLSNKKENHKTSQKKTQRRKGKGNQGGKTKGGNGGKEKNKSK